MDILIAGAGIGGLTAAIALQRAGHNVKIAERAKELKAVGAGIALAGNAMRALHHIGVGELVEQVGVELNTAEIVIPSGKVIARTILTQPINGKALVGRTLLRADLHQLLLEALQTNTLYTNLTVAGFRQSTEKVQLNFTDGSIWEGDLLIAADGIHSTIRKQILPEVEPRYAGYICWRGVTEVNPDFHALRFTETWGIEGRFGVCPVSDDRVYWYACINAATPNDSRYQNWSVADLKKQFAGYHNPVNELLTATLPSQLMLNPIIDLSPLQQLAYGRVLLLGDAGHATTPNLGQGACQAIEDAVLLPQFLSTATTVEKSLNAFSAIRLPRTTTIVERSWLLGKVAQTESRVLAGIRNLLMQLTPESAARKQLKFIHDVDFGR